MLIHIFILYFVLFVLISSNNIEGHCWVIYDVTCKLLPMHDHVMEY